MLASLTARAIENHRPPGRQATGNGAQEAAGEGGEEEKKERDWRSHAGRIERIAVAVTVMSAAVGPGRDPAGPKLKIVPRISHSSIPLIKLNE